MTTTEDVIDAAKEVHAELGGKQSEATYHRSMERELSDRGIGFTSEGTIPIFYKGAPVGKRRPDMFVDGTDGTIVVELKARSSSGKQQLFGYQDILDSDDNFSMAGGVLIRFNEELEVVRA